MFENGLYKTLLDNLYDGVYFTDLDRRIKYWNKAAERISGFSADEVLEKKCSDNVLMHVDFEGNSLCLGSCPLKESLQDSKPRQDKVYLHHKEGHLVPIRVSIAPICDEVGNVIGGLETFQDVTHEMATLKEVEVLKEQAYIDSLTKIGNRRYCDLMLEKRFRELQFSEEGSLGIMFFDIDHFKNFNDQYGHKVGDLVLKMVARTLMNSMRTYDFVGRWGGEEFLAITPNVPQDQLWRLADRYRTLVKQSSYNISEEKISITVSVGATLVHKNESKDDALARADALLYKSKSAGRNCASV